MATILFLFDINPLVFKNIDVNDFTFYIISFKKFVLCDFSNRFCA